MSDTPLTDAVLTNPERDGNDLPNLSRTLERELAEARKDSARLDWLDSGPIFPHIFWSAVVNHPEDTSGECAVALDGNKVFYAKTFRAAIDAAKEDKP